MFIDFEVTLDSGGGTFDLVYMNRTVDTCMFLKNKKVNIIVDIIYKILTAYGELPTTCPLQKVGNINFQLQITDLMHQIRFHFLNAEIVQTSERIH